VTPAAENTERTETGYWIFPVISVASVVNVIGKVEVLKDGFALHYAGLGGRLDGEAG
jgi:hypothetical protein